MSKLVFKKKYEDLQRKERTDRKRHFDRRQKIIVFALRKPRRRLQFKSVVAVSVSVPLFETPLLPAAKTSLRSINPDLQNITAISASPNNRSTMGDGTELADSDELIRRRRALTSRTVIGREWLHVLVDNFPLINVTSADFRTHAPILKRTEENK